MDFPLYFQNVIWPGGGHFFIIKQFSQDLVVMWAKPNSVTPLLSPLLPLGVIWSHLRDFFVPRDYVIFLSKDVANFFLS